MDIGKMRSRITIQQAVVQKDAIGNHTNAWEDFYSCAAYEIGRASCRERVFRAV